MLMRSLVILAFALPPAEPMMLTHADRCESSENVARCSCAPGNQTAPQAAAASALVITGVVQKIERTTDRLDGNPLVHVTVRADAKWKGTSTDSVFVIVTSSPSGFCGYNFELDREYAIFATSTAMKDEYYTSICHRTRDARSAAKDMTALGSPTHSFRWNR